MKRLAALTLSAAMIGAFALPADAQRRGWGGGGDAVMFSDPDFRGASLPVNGPIPSLGDLRFNDKASSLAIRGGSWEICSDADFRGKCRVVSGSAPQLNRIGMNDNISSIRPAGYGGNYGRPDNRPGRPGGHDYGRPGGGYGHAPRGSAVVYEHPDFRGEARTLTGPVRHMHQVRMNDRASSVEIRGGSWQLCTDPDFRGRCEIVSYPVGQLNQIRLNDTISSMRPVTRGWTDNDWRRDRYGPRW